MSSRQQRDRLDRDGRGYRAQAPSSAAPRASSVRAVARKREIQSLWSQDRTRVARCLDGKLKARRKSRRHMDATVSAVTGITCLIPMCERIALSDGGVAAGEDRASLEYFPVFLDVLLAGTDENRNGGLQAVPLRHVILFWPTGTN